MRKLLALLSVAVLVASLASPAVAGQKKNDFYPIEAGLQPEGVAVDRAGNAFIGVDTTGPILKFTRRGKMSVFYDFGSPGLLGMATDHRGNVYVARGFPYLGVWKVARDGGSAVMLPGTDQIVLPNALAFDWWGNLYISETFSFDAPLQDYSASGCAMPDITQPPGTLTSEFGPGGIWKVPPGGEAELWLRDGPATGFLLTGVCAPVPIPFPIGANGIGYWFGTVYVNNTEKNLVVEIPVALDGSPGVPAVFGSVPDLDPPPPPEIGPPFLDGLAIDWFGNVYVTVINQSRVVRISRDASTYTTVADGDDNLDFPSSVATGKRWKDRKKLFVVNYAIGPPGGAGPGLVKIKLKRMWAPWRL